MELGASSTDRSNATGRGADLDGVEDDVSYMLRFNDEKTATTNTMISSNSTKMGMYRSILLIPN